MNNIHGLIACGGNATRFAQSVGQPPPYPKHLEMIGDKSVLERAVNSILTNVGSVSGITFVLNPRLKDQYVAYLSKLQSEYPTIPFSYTAGEKADENEGLFSELRRTMRNELYDLEGQMLQFEDPTVAFGFGDAIVRIRDQTRMQDKLREYEERIRSGKTVTIVDMSRWSPGTLYIIGRLNYLPDTRYPNYEIEAVPYGLKTWNINTREDLIRAKIDLGYPLTEGELSLSPQGRSREFR